MLFSFLGAWVFSGTMNTRASKRQRATSSVPPADTVPPVEDPPADAPHAAHGLAYSITVPGEVAQERLAQLVHFGFTATRTLDRDNMARLGILEELDELINGVGWMGVAQIAHHTYREPSIEFLATLRVIPPAATRPHHQISYQLGGRQFQLSLAEFNIALGFETAESINSQEYTLALRVTDPPGFSPTRAWLQFTGQDDYIPKMSKASSLRDPIMRIFHKWITSCIFARHESTGNVSIHHLFILWAAYYRRHVDAGLLFAQSCVELARRKSSPNKRAFIAIGSFITELCYFHDVFDPRATRVARLELIDASTLQNMGMLSAGQLIRPQPAAQEEDQQQDEAQDDAVHIDPVEEDIPQAHDQADSTHSHLLRLEHRMERLELQVTEQYQLHQASIDSHFQQLQGHMDQRFDALLAYLQGASGSAPPPPPPPS